MSYNWYHCDYYSFGSSNIVQAGFNQDTRWNKKKMYSFTYKGYENKKTASTIKFKCTDVFKSIYKVFFYNND